MRRLSITEEARARLDTILAGPSGRRIGVFGLGIAGKAMALYLARRGAAVIGVDGRVDLSDVELAQAGVTLRLGPETDGVFDDVEALVISPGVHPDKPAVQRVLTSGRPVLGELELTAPLPAKVIGITGTNGKSTTTALIGALLEGLGDRVFVGGNFGDPIAAWVDAKQPTDVAVLELSSFQLETAYRFRADVGVMLNVTPDHTDRYVDIEAYAEAKRRLLENLGADGVAVLSADDVRVRAMAEHTQAKVRWFSTRGAEVPGDGLSVSPARPDIVVGHGALSGWSGFDLAHPRLMGLHNRENALAAILAVHGVGPVDEAALRVAYLGFPGLEHRLETVGEVDGVRYINDSKATNDDAAAIAIKAMDRPFVLLLGGRDKGGGYDQVIATCKKATVRGIIAFGEARPIIVAALASHFDVKEATGLDDACAQARILAKAGDAVLLSPACASFDEFKDYKHRGKVFKAWVESAGGKHA